jgi:hypothetical protein
MRLKQSIARKIEPNISRRDTERRNAAFFIRPPHLTLETSD